MYLLAALTTSLLQPIHFQGHAGQVLAPWRTSFTCIRQLQLASRFSIAKGLGLGPMTAETRLVQSLSESELLRDEKAEDVIK